MFIAGSFTHNMEIAGERFGLPNAMEGDKYHFVAQEEFSLGNTCGRLAEAESEMHIGETRRGGHKLLALRFRGASRVAPLLGTYI
jgi:hypothetical protein